MKYIFIQSQHLLSIIIFKGKKVLKKWFKENIIKDIMIAFFKKS